MKFKSYLLLYIVLFVLLVSFVKSQKTLTLSGVIYDQFPLFNPNFEPDNGSVTKGIVKSTLNTTTRVPELTSLDRNSVPNIHGRIVRPELFQYFFTSNNNASSAGYNVAIPINLTLNYNQATGIYTYSNQSFFPIDYRGFDVDASKRIYKDGNNKYHNFHFTLKINSKFTYQGGEVFSFTGDDDFYVYIDNKLVIDLGGLHVAESASVNLDKLGLTKGRNYNIDFFYCERHTVKSTIKLETNIEIACDYNDYCGVCNGDGSSCCNSATTCNDNNPCTVDSCPPATTAIPSGSPISDYCIHTPKQAPPSNDLCFNYQCNNSSGNFDQIPIQCLNLSSQCLVNTGCSSTAGCKYESSCNDVCQVKGQCNNGTCVSKSSEYCAQELDGNSTDLCSVYSCDSNAGGCIKQDKCQQSSNKCVVTSCNSTDGSCLVENTPNPYANNSCITSNCDPDTGLYSSSPITCPDRSNECLINVGCNPSTGCEYESSCTDICQVKDQCNNGTCVSKSSEYCAQELDGNSTDLCSVYSCDSNAGGCIKQDKCQQSSNKCVVTSCNSTDGSCLVENTSNPYSNDSCVTSSCDPDTGLYSSSPIVCPDRSNECLSLVGCNPSTGCEYESYCKGVCDAKDQCNNGTCIPKTPEYCANELDGDNVDLCKVYSCDSKGCGCIKQDKCTNNNINNTNPCTTTSCKVSTGECFEIEIPSDKCDCGCVITNKCWRSNCTKDGKCQPVLREEIDDNDQCTDDYCDPCTGNITHVIASKCLNCNQCS